MSDSPRQSRTNSDIERFAEGWRKALDPDDTWAPSMMELIAKAGREFKDVFGLYVDFVSDAAMADDEARTEFDPLRICLRKSLQSYAVSNAPYVRGTLAHELGHAIFHRGLPKSRKASGDGRDAYMAAFKKIESEAWVFARAFLMPSWKLDQVSTALELALRCRVPNKMAEIRFTNACRRPQNRSEPPGFRLALERLKSSGALGREDPRITAERDRMQAWARARQIDGEDPMRVRRSDDAGAGYEVHWRDHGRELSAFGWFVKDGQVLAYYGRDH